MKKAQYDHQPPRLESIGNGAWHYRWGLAEIEATTTTDAVWECYECIVWNTPTRESITEAALTTRWPLNEEAKKINDYNGAKEGLLLEKDYKEIYKEFLKERSAIKEEIKAFFGK